MDAAPDLISAADRQLRRLELLIEQQRLHIMAVHPSRRPPQHRALRGLLAEYTRLLDRRVNLARRKSTA